ncbi:MAG: hypothetical protein NZ480_09180 [Bdellovibrionaceae bacterium]|nr:hypothetical protein [Pseudobdellovibrionaceae bacterium]MDW8189432.1 hypothetical protein [Pseudobdellovibrionaceae bacterium]
MRLFGALLLLVLLISLLAMVSHNFESGGKLINNKHEYFSGLRKINSVY